eukprot:365122-Chlamydomonas_euryale.AAC.59
MTQSGGNTFAKYASRELTGHKKKVSEAAALTEAAMACSCASVCMRMSLHAACKHAATESTFFATPHAT